MTLRIGGVQPYIVTHEDFVRVVVEELATEARSADSILQLFRVLIDVRPDIGIPLGVPRNRRARESLMALLEDDAFPPVVSLLAERLLSYLALLPELADHPLASSDIRLIDERVNLVRDYARTHTTPRIRRSVEMVAPALDNRTLDWFRGRQPDLWVVLKTLGEDLDAQARDPLIAFAVRQLDREVVSPGHIPERRHIWWTVQTLCRELASDLPESVTEAIRRLLEHPVPSGKAPSGSIIPEVYVEGREELWEAVNVARIVHSAEHSLPADLPPRLRSRLLSAANRVLPAQESQSFYGGCLRLLFAYELTVALQRLENEKIVGWETIYFSDHGVGESLFASDLASDARALIHRAQELLNQEQWTPLEGAAVISGGPGTGKTFLMKAIANEIELSCEQAALPVNSSLWTVGDTLFDTGQISDYLRSVDCESVQVLMIDEFDKAEFDLYLSMLPILDPPEKALHERSLFLFAQSTFPDFASLARHAARLPNKAMRDFLTRIQLGHVDMLDLRLSSEQRLMAALGIVTNLYPECRGVSRVWIQSILGQRFSNARMLKNWVRQSSVLVGTDVLLRGEQSGLPRSVLNLEGGYAEGSKTVDEP